MGENINSFYSQYAFLTFILKLIPTVGDRTVSKILGQLKIDFDLSLNNYLNLINDISINYFNSKQKLSLTNFKSELHSKILFYLKNFERNNIKVICFKDVVYPKALFSLSDYPTLLFIKGDFDFSKYDFNKSIAVIGTRNYTNYGEFYCRYFVKNLSLFDFSFVSGLAYGIDYIAHEEALKNNAYCLGVLGHGFDYIYPYSSKDLYSKIIQSNGILISEYLPDIKPDKTNFPARNRIIAGLAKGTLVVEADKDSGSLITANIAFDIGRTVFAIPADLNRKNSQGCNLIISSNIAKLVIDYLDILKEFNINIKNFSQDQNFKNMLVNLRNKLDENQLKIYTLILQNKLNSDDIVNLSQLDPTTTLNIISELENMKIIKRGDDDFWYISTSL